MDFGALVQTALNLVLTILNGTKLNGTQITTVVNFLIGIIPVVEKEFSDLLVPIENIIEALKTQDSATPEQMAMLEALLGSSDDDYDAAFAAYKAAHPDTN